MVVDGGEGFLSQVVRQVYPQIIITSSVAADNGPEPEPQVRCLLSSNCFKILVLQLVEEKDVSVVEPG